jgi:5-methylcytosine-specific restriction endonuclease McrA
VGIGWRLGASERFELRLALFDRDGPWCHWCDVITSAWDSGRRDAMTIDHKQRRRDGGTDDPANLVIACWQCNHDRN